MGNATPPMFAGDTDEAHRLATELVMTSSPPSKAGSDDGAIPALIDEVRRASELPYREELAVRLELLLEAFDEDYDGEVLSADSLRSMLAFLERVPSLPYPTVTLTPGGESCASWESEGDFAFNTLFHASERVQFYIIYPNAYDITVSDELSGSTTSRSLPDLAAYVRLGEWAEK